MIGAEVSADEAAQGWHRGNGKSGALPFGTSKAHQARMHDYALGTCFDEMLPLFTDYEAGINRNYTELASAGGPWRRGGYQQA